MIDRININTEGGDYDEVNNHGQYAKGNIYNYPPTPPESRDRSEAKLLAAVKNEVAGRLAQSLHNRVYIELNKEEDPSQVIQPWAVDVKLGSQPSQRCPEGTNIVDIFDKPEIGGKLLILGAPGSGKTMMLLQLAEELVDRADKNASRPVPVLLNLSAWKPEFKDIPSWMVADLKLKYGVRQDIAKKWIEEGRILPLLDGLDELMSERQETCVGALNEFLPAWSGVPLVVCSRREEYQNYEANLGLHGAVILQPLTDGQIEKFLRGAGCKWLWEAVRQDSDVMGEEGLARSPLLLTILVLASGGLPGELWQKKESAEERRRVLFEAFIAERLKRRYVGGKNLPATKYGQKPYRDDEKTKAWLCWLAMRLIEENQTEFFIEKLQPKLLKDKGTRLHASILISLVSLGIGGIIGISASLATGSMLGILAGFIYGLTIGLVYTILRSFLWWRFSEDINFIAKIEFSWNIFKKEFPLNVSRSCIDGLAYGFLIGILVFFLPNIQIEFVRSLLLSMSVGLAYGFFAGIVQSIRLYTIDTKYRDNQSVFISLANSFVFIAFFLPVGFCASALLLEVIYGKFPGWSSILILGTGFGCVFGLANGGMHQVSDHVALRATLWLFGYSPWNYSKFLRYCTERGFLQRVGGGYRFVHALLRDHFAAQYTPK